MASERNKVGEAYVEISADTSRLKQEIGSAERSTRRFADEAESSGKRASTAFAGLGDTMTKVQAAVSRILIPAAVVGAVGALAEKFRQAAREAEAFSRSLDDIGAKSSALRQSGLAEQFTNAQKEQRQLVESYNQLQTEIQNQVTQAIERENSSLASLRASFVGLFTDAPVTAAEKVEEAIRRANTLQREQQGALADLRRRQAEQESKERAAAEQKREHELHLLRMELLRSEADARKRLDSEIAAIRAENDRKLEEAKGDMEKQNLIERIEAAKIAQIEAQKETIAAAEQAEAEAIRRNEEMRRRMIRETLQGLAADLAGSFGAGSLASDVAAIRVELQTNARVGR